MRCMSDPVGEGPGLYTKGGIDIEIGGGGLYEALGRELSDGVLVRGIS